jgi:hypothetical protein
MIAYYKENILKFVTTTPSTNAKDFDGVMNSYVNVCP